MSKKLSYLLIGVTLLAIVGCSKDSFKEASKEITNDTEATTEASNKTKNEESIEDQNVTVEKENVIVEIEKEVIVEKEVIKEVEKEVIVEKPVEKEVIKYQTVYSDSKKITMPEKSKGSYLSTVKGKYSQVAYLGHEYKVKTDNSKPKWSTSTPDILSITSDGYVMAKKQGFEYGDVSFQCTQKWVAYGDPRTVLEVRRGVCAEASSLVCGLLQYDYEEVGTINVSSYGYGHAYSYVYEDGFYYVFDCTSLFSRNIAMEDVEIKKCASIDEIKIYVVDYYNNHVMDTNNDNINNTGIAIYMANSKHVGCVPPTYSSFHTGGNFEAFKKGYAYNGVEKGFEVTLLWSNPKIKYEIKYIPSRQVKEDGCRTFFLYD